MIKTSGAGGARATRLQTRDGKPINPRTSASRTRSAPASSSPAPPTTCGTSSNRSTTTSAASATCLMMGQGGHITHEDTVDNLTLFSKEVLPRMAELG